MFKKLMAFSAWAFLLCTLFIICLFISIGMGHAFLFSCLIWFVLILAIILMRIIWGCCAEISKAKWVARFLGRFNLSRMECVLYEHWKTGAKVIKRIGGRKQPLLWFVLTGGRSGKTTLMASAGLPLFSDEPENHLVVPTRTLRWWFFRTVGFLDLSSHFLSKTPTFDRAWLRLVSWCGRMPAPSGVVVCISLSELQATEGMDTHLRARRIRTQIEPLMKKVKRRLPVYLFITQCDELPGFSVWAKKLSPAQRQQALGYYWLHSPVVDGKDPAFLNPAFATLKAGLDKVRVSMFSGKEPDADTLLLLNFPEQLATLQPALQRYLAALCEPDAYFEPAALGGVWFTATEPVSKNSAARQTFFLHDLITTQLPALSRQREFEALGVGRRFLQKWGNITAFGIALIALLVSGNFTRELVTGDPAQLRTSQQVDQLEKIEGWHRHPLRYLPFLPVLHHRHQQLEHAVIEQTPRQTINVQDVVASYQEVFQQAESQEQRQLILELADTVITRQAMLDNQPLDRLLERQRPSSWLDTTGVTEPVSPLHETILQRGLLQQPGGADHVLALRRLLITLINSDPDWKWLVAPSATLPAITMSDFYPSITDSEPLDGLWTRQGTAQISAWLQTVRQAANDPSALPVLDTFEQQWPMLRQNHWMTFILLMNRQPIPTLEAKEWQNLLVSIEQSNSPSMTFSHVVNEQLEDISTRQATPWLKELRRLNQLQQSPSQSAISQHMGRVDQRIRQKVAGWLMLDKKALNPAVTDAHIKAWNSWRTSLRAAVSDALDSQENSSHLTQGLFTKSEGEDKNPLQQLSGRFSALRKSMTPDTTDFAVNAVWSLYQAEDRQLIAHAMQRSGCWIQQQWQSQVLWPMDKNADHLDYASQQDQAWQYLTDFIRGPARNVLIVADDGPTAGAFEGQSVALTPGFLRLVNHVLRPDDVLAMPERKSTRHADELGALVEQQTKLEAQLAKREEKPLELTLKSQPATIPGGARLMPIGTQLLLACDEQQWTLKSMNFSEQAMFRWRPGHCSRVTVTVNFPGFDLQYNYLGDSAWPDFLTDIADGQESLSAEDFPEQTAQLNALGIKKILIRYQAGPQNAVQDAWQQWQALNLALDDNSEAQLTVKESKQKQQAPSGSHGAISQLPARIAECN